MKIPKTIQLLGVDVKVIIDNDFCDKHQVLGHANYDFLEIKLSDHYHDKKLPQDKIDENFIHELLHLILEKLGYEELRKDERFINGLSSTILQVIKQIT